MLFLAASIMPCKCAAAVSISLYLYYPALFSAASTPHRCTIEELDKKERITIHKKKQGQLNDEVSMYGLKEDTIEYVLFSLRECTGKLI